VTASCSVSTESARAARVFRKPPPKVLTLIQERRSAGISLREIASELNQLGIRTPRGGQWYACTAERQIRKAGAVSVAVEEAAA
jgi:hypothetical protein